MSALTTAADAAREVTRIQAELNQAREARDAAIRYAVLDPAVTIAEMSRTTGLTRTMLYKILGK